MSPVELQVLLWYYSRLEPVPSNLCHDTSVILTDFVNDGLVVWPEGKFPECTPRGVAFLEHVLNLPLPEQKWVMPGVDT